MSMKIAFIDRDGTLLNEPQGTHQINGLEQMSFLPFVISSLIKLQNNGYELVIVSNQDGLGTKNNPINNYEIINTKVLEILASDGVIIKEILTCPHLAAENCDCRKPKTSLVKHYQDIDKSSSVMIGDRDSDLEFANNFGIRGFKLIPDVYEWKNIVSDILSRKAHAERKTKETDISVKINLDNQNAFKSDLSTGLKFLDHMLEQVAKHAKFALQVRCNGDLHIDEHHTIEDVAICLGDVIRKALGDKRGVERFASTKIIPLDESISFVSIDLSGRPFCKFDCKFDREYVGDVPTEMISHFFHSFAISAGITLHIKIEGENTHHKVESCFKAFAKAMHEVTRITSDSIASTKGML